MALRLYAEYVARRMRPPFRNTDYIICGSRWAASALVRGHGRSAHAIRSLPYPIDLDLFRPAPSAEASDDTVELLWTGRIVPRKRLDLFLDAGQILIEQGRSVQLTVVGGFPFAKGFRRLLEEFPFPERLAYLPSLPRTDLIKMYQRATVVVQPSEEENFGSSVAEALACGTSVVVGPTNGTAEYIGEGGERFRSYQPSDVAAALVRLLDRRAADAPGLAARARQAAEENFSIQRIVDRLEIALDRASRT